MSLYLLAGPINMLVDPDDSTLGGVAGFWSADRCIWDDSVGWFGHHPLGDMTGCGNSGLVTCNLDGITRLRTYLPSAFGIANIQQDELTDKVIVIYSAGVPILFNPVTMLVDPPVALNSMNDVFLRTKYGWIRNSSNNIQIAPLDATDTGDFVTVHTLTPNPGINSAAHFCLGPDRYVYFWNGSGNTICIFDMVAQEEVFPDGVTTNRWTLDHNIDRLQYSRKLGVLLTYEEDALTSGQGILHIYSTELIPNAISAPVASPAVAAGLVSEISVTLTDDNGVGIPDRLIDWSITAGDGDLLDDQSETNSAGVAVTRYRAPIGGGANPTIQASLTY